MLDHAQEAVVLAQGKSRSDLASDRLLELALVRLLEVVGEAASRVSGGDCARYPEIPWPQMVGLRIARDGYWPFQVVALGAKDTQPTAIPLLQERGLANGRAAAYLCRDFACQAPITEQEVLQAQLEHR